MGNTVSDLMYPDNPKRRQRAEGLRQDLRQFQAEFERARDLKDQAFKRVKDELDKVLTKLGVNTREELDKYIRDNMKDDAQLKAYDELRNNIDEFDKNANLIVDIVGLAGLGTFAIGSLAALIGIITFATAMGALEVVGGLAAAIGLVVVILSIYEGAVQRQKLREAIHTMLGKRTEAYQCVERMKILNSWANTIANSLEKGESFEDLKDFLQEGLKEPWDACSLASCAEKLRQTDIDNGAWMDEDGGYFYSAEASFAEGDNTGKVPCVELSVTPARGESQNVKMTLQGSISDSVCMGTTESDTWFLSGKPVEDVYKLESELYDLERVAKGRDSQHEMLEACRLKLLGITWA